MRGPWKLLAPSSPGREKRRGREGSEAEDEWTVQRRMESVGDRRGNAEGDGGEAAAGGDHAGESSPALLILCVGSLWVSCSLSLGGSLLEYGEI